MVGVVPVTLGIRRSWSLTSTRLDVLAVLFGTECQEPGGFWRIARLQDTLEAREAGFKASEGIGSASNKVTLPETVKPK